MAHNGSRSHTPRKEQAIAALLESANILEAAQLSGVPRRTLYHWLSQAGFRQELEQAKRQLVDAAVNTLRLASRGAVDVLKRIAHDEAQPAAARVSAAKAIIQLTIEAATIADIETRLKELEKTRTIDGQAEWNDDGKISRIA